VRQSGSCAGAGTTSARWRRSSSSRRSVGRCASTSHSRFAASSLRSRWTSRLRRSRSSVPPGPGRRRCYVPSPGLARPKSGRITCRGETWFDADRRTNMLPEDRRVGYVFHEYALFPHLTAEQNVDFAGERADRLLRRLGIEHLANITPAELSGGERQRVVLARALARNPRASSSTSRWLRSTRTRAASPTELHDLLGERRRPRRRPAPTGRCARRASRGSCGSVCGAARRRQRAFWRRGPCGARPYRSAARRGADDLRLRTHGDGRWGVSLGREAAADSALKRVRDEIVSLTPLGNRARVRLPLLTAEITTASLERLQLGPGEPVVASFKAMQTRLLSS
jgi:ABC transporter/TOBE domain